MRVESGVDICVDLVANDWYDRYEGDECSSYKVYLERRDKSSRDYLE